MKIRHPLPGFFRDTPHGRVEFHLRLTIDLRDPRQAHRYKRRRECAVRLSSKPLSERHS